MQVSGKHTDLNTPCKEQHISPPPDRAAAASVQVQRPLSLSRTARSSTSHHHRIASPGPWSLG